MTIATLCNLVLPYICSAGEEWNENPETYESSFYKRSLDNEMYIFTAPSFNCEFLQSNKCMFFFYICWYEFVQKSFFFFMGSGTKPFLLSDFGCYPNPTGRDRTLRLLISLQSFTSSQCVCSSPPPSPPLFAFRVTYISCLFH